jgi:3-phosphoshikimate 1-carboxyvinyltransferase
MSTRLVIRRTRALRGTTRVPGDKSISHRALILGALAAGENRVRGWLAAGDTLATLDAMRALGVTVRRERDVLLFHGGKLRAPAGPIDCRNAGTALRLLAGLLVGQPFPSVLDGSAQLRRRPMRRIVEPLCQMGADLAAAGGHAPLHVRPAPLHGIRYRLPVASAQVKSALLLAGLHAQGETEVVEPGPARDHTERMLQAMGADLRVDGQTIAVAGGRALQPLDMTIPGDFSSAAFLVVGALLAPGSAVTVADVGLNQTRTGLVDILQRMGADCRGQTQRQECGEDVGTIAVRSQPLRGTHVAGGDVVRAIDELPILSVAATQAAGETTIRDAAELRAKEVDRIAVVAAELRKLGARITELPDGMIVAGQAQLQGTIVDSHGDHRLGMALAVAGLVAAGETVVEGAACIEDSFPSFARTLGELGADVRADE